MIPGLVGMRMLLEVEVLDTLLGSGFGGRTHLAPVQDTQFV